MAVSTKPVVVVTGASHGIGRNIAEHLYEDGWAVALWDVDRPEPSLPVAQVAQVDVANSDAVRDAMNGLVQVTGRLDAIVNNAAITGGRPWEDWSPAVWDRTIGVNLSGYYYLAWYGLPHLKQGEWSSIVNVASINSFAAEPGAVGYVASKGGVMALTNALAVDLGEWGIRVNAVAPGPIKTDKNRHLYDNKDPGIEGQLAKIPLNRAGCPGDVANAVSWLLSKESSFVNGQTLRVDGGLLSRI